MINRIHFFHTRSESLLCFVHTGEDGACESMLISDSFRCEEVDRRIVESETTKHGVERVDRMNADVLHDLFETMGADKLNNTLQ